MNKNKLIFGIIAGLIVFFIVFLVFSIKNNAKPVITNASQDFKIWIINDDKTDFLSLVNEFKTINAKYKNTNIIVESFSNYEEYSYALSSAINSNNAPDIFVLNNNEKTSIFDGQAMGLDPTIFNPNDFRKKYKGVFSDDLITTFTEGEKQKEALVGVPVGYETLGIFYNGRYIKDTDLQNMSSLNKLISDLKTQKPSYTPIGIGNGSTVYDAPDIVTQFFMLENGITKLEDITGDKLKEPLGSYLFYGDESGDNSYNSKFVELMSAGNNNLDLFSKGDIFMIIGYPSLIKKINEKGYSKNLLRASPFPHYFAGEGKTLVNYNYFVINKNTINYNLSSDFLSYLISDSGASSYLNKFTYYLPALLGLESDKLEEKIHNEYKIVLKDFLNNDYLLTSFDKGIKNIYDRDIVSILDNSTTYETEFLKFKNKLICLTKKVVKLEKLSQDCN